MALEKPGTMAATSAPRVAKRLAWSQWRRVQRPLKPAGKAVASPFPLSAAARRFLMRIRRPRPESWDKEGSVIDAFPVPA